MCSRQRNRVETAYEHGIIEGYANGKFGPQDLITKEQAMTMLVRAMKLAGMDVDVPQEELADQLKLFTDSDNVSSYARQGALICTRYGLFIENTKGELTPKDNFTRAESSTVVLRLLKKAKLI